MATKNERIETDSMGEMSVPADAYYGAQTARAVENFPISGIRKHSQLIKALRHDKTRRRRKQHGARLVNQENGKRDSKSRAGSD